MSIYAPPQQPVLQRGIMSSINAFIKKNPVLTYYALTFAISWGGFLAETLRSITELGQPAIAGTSPLSRTS